MKMNLMELRKRAPELLDSIIESVVLEDYYGALAATEELERYVQGLGKSIERRLAAKKENEGKG